MPWEQDARRSPTTHRPATSETAAPWPFKSRRATLSDLTPATAADLGACPECGEALRAFALRGTLGFRLVELGDMPHSLPRAVAVADPDLRPGRSATVSDPHMR